ncbi:MAG: sugar ABC transporter permease [Oscillospiraceae bacterium]|nr:sugar ABC transporter permease [Oscillospiraceae bacterium]
MHKQNKSINLFYVPALILFAIFVVYPFMKGIYLSFTNWNGYAKTFKMVGFDNYIKMFSDPNVRTAIVNTLIYGAGSTLIQNVLGLLLALLLNQKFYGRSLVRTVVYLPVMIAPLIMGYVMYFFFTFNNGAINDILAVFGVAPVDWLADGKRARVILTVVNSLQFVGVSMVIYLAGLQNISGMYYDAAAIDGVNAVQKFFYVTVPLLMPSITSSVTINLIGGLKLFDVISALTGGGPGYDTNSMSTLIHRLYFGGERAGYASAVGLVFFVFIMIISNIVVNALQRKQVEM